MFYPSQRWVEDQTPTHDEERVQSANKPKDTIQTETDTLAIADSEHTLNWSTRDTEWPTQPTTNKSPK